jgi:hypothetical protein
MAACKRESGFTHQRKDARAARWGRVATSQLLVGRVIYMAQKILHTQTIKKWRRIAKMDTKKITKRTNDDQETRPTSDHKLEKTKYYLVVYSLFRVFFSYYRNDILQTFLFHYFPPFFTPI